MEISNSDIVKSLNFDIADERDYLASLSILRNLLDSLEVNFSVRLVGELQYDESLYGEVVNILKTEIAKLDSVYSTIHILDKHFTFICKKNNNLVGISTNKNSTFIELHGSDENELEELSLPFVKGIRNLVTKFETGIVPIIITNYGKYGVEKRYIHIDTLLWSDIEINYPSNIRKYFEALLEEEDYFGKLIVWYGETGSGKSYAIRSLASHIKDNYSVVQVSDPEVFLSNSGYYYELVDDSDKPCLIVMEDSADSLLKENRARYGDKVSKLLNFTDGLLSKGRKDLFLITFNEKLSELDDAIMRPGRCHSIIEFTRLNKEERIEWLNKHKLDVKSNSSKSLSLAELYSLLNKNKSTRENPKKVKKERDMGFV